ncbi:MAG: thioesterase [Ruminococcus sp.]|nr:thioesterase [Ruminococcus sp.]
MRTRLGYKSFPYLHRLSGNERQLLFCFHHAGGSASAFFRNIGKAADIAVIPTELPAHGSRMEEEPLCDWDRLISHLCGEISELSEQLRKPFSLIGCSLGSLIAFECALRLEKMGTPAERAIICSHSSPDVVSPGYKTSMGRERLIDEVKLLSGTDSALFENKDVLDFYLDVIYGDYLLHDSYVYSGAMLKSTDLYVFCGRSDPYFNRDNMKNWQKMTSAHSSYTEFDGGHFFLYEGDNFRKVLDKSRR